jgi:hypothetical protein
VKAYLVGVFDYVFHAESVFLDKKEAMAYVEENNRIPFDGCDKLCIKEVELNPTSYKKIVGIHGYADKDKDIQDLEIKRIESKDMEELKDFAGEKITFRPGKWVEGTTDFDGIADVTPCKDLTKCHEYVKDIIAKHLLRSIMNH